MWALIVAVAYLLNGEVIEDKMKYNQTMWPTKAECETFVASDAGQSSLDGLKMFLTVRTDGLQKFEPECVQQEGTQ